MNRIFGWLVIFILVHGVFLTVPLSANELVRGKVVEINSSRLVIRLPDGQKTTIYISSDTKFMHKAGSGEQSEAPNVKKNARVAVSLDGNTAAFVVVEEVPK